MYHWTDSKIRVYGPTCVMALLYLSLLHKKLKSAGLDLSLILRVVGPHNPALKKQQTADGVRAQLFVAPSGRPISLSKAS